MRQPADSAGERCVSRMIAQCPARSRLRRTGVIFARLRCMRRFLRTGFLGCLMTGVMAGCGPVDEFEAGDSPAEEGPSETSSPSQEMPPQEMPPQEMPPQEMPVAEPPAEDPPPETSDEAAELRARLLATLPQPALPATPYSYSGDPRPARARTSLTDSFDTTPIDNPITDAGAALGRVLFYDRLLSENGTIACASCHVQAFAFSDPRPLSLGFDGRRTERNSMPLLNLRYYGGGERQGAMFWDHRAPSLETQVLMPIQDTVEMGLTLDELQLRVTSAAYYPPLFEAAFGTSDVSAERIALALAQFVRAIASFRSRWDEGIATGARPNEDFSNFTAQENEGKRLFFGAPRGGPPGGGGGPSCAVCHLPGGPDNLSFFFMDGAKNNGLPEDDDVGFGLVTGDRRDDRKFKSPSLRNVELTGPFMHDGRFQSLEQVVRFYSGQIAPDPNLDRVLVGPNGQPLRFAFNSDQQAALVAFLRTLTDSQITTDPRFADPFDAP